VEIYIFIASQGYYGRVAYISHCVA